jgi:hypothetical protein
MSAARVLRLLPFALAILLAGCAGRPYVYNDTLSSSYRTTEFGYGAGRRDLTTVIRGNPFGMDQEAFDRALIEILNRNQPRPQPTNFTTTPGESARPAYRAQFIFNAPAAVNSLSVCRAEVPQVETPDLVRLSAAFCRSGGALTSLMAQIEGVESVDDPRFEALMSQVVALMFPLHNPDADDDDPFVPD